MAYTVIAALGNPGAEYDGTRHNAGFLCADEFVQLVQPKASFRSFRCGTSWREKFGSLLVEGEYDGSNGTVRFVVLKPQGYMNRSGGPIAEYLKFYQRPVSELLVLHDELDLPLGSIRVKSEGGHGGHNGLRSIIAAVGSDVFARVRIGVGRPHELAKSEVPTADWVLSRPGGQERTLFEESVVRAAEVVRDLFSEPLAKVQKRVHTTPKNVVLK